MSSGLWEEENPVKNASRDESFGENFSSNYFPLLRIFLPDNSNLFPSTVLAKNDDVYIRVRVENGKKRRKTSLYCCLKKRGRRKKWKINKWRSEKYFFGVLLFAGGEWVSENVNGMWTCLRRRKEFLICLAELWKQILLETVLNMWSNKFYKIRSFGLPPCILSTGKVHHSHTSNQSIFSKSYNHKNFSLKTFQTHMLKKKKKIEMAAKLLNLFAYRFLQIL